MEKPWLEQSKKEKNNYLKQNTTDCKFLVGMKDKEEPRLVEGYKLILSSISPAFERMFKGDFKEAKSTDPVVIEDIYYNDFEQFLEFVYNENALVANWKSLYDIAKKYLADGIIEVIIRVLDARHITPSKALYLFQIKFLEQQAYNVKKVEFKGNNNFIFELHIGKLMTAMDMPCIHHLDPHVFLELVKNLSRYSNKHERLFVAIDNYCANENHFSSHAEKLEFISLYLNSIDFNTMTCHAFFCYVEPSDLLDLRTKHRVLVDICRNQK